MSPLKLMKNYVRFSDTYTAYVQTNKQKLN